VSRIWARARARLLRAWFDRIINRQKDLARLMKLEQGKPLEEARGEMTYGASFVEWFAGEARRT
jgi:succinate-semialdehyde dehydrogenase/glutarate-semialdehyde dehydrogenase